MKKQIFIVLIFLFSCQPKINLEYEKQNMMQTDIEFSNRSVEVGAHQAFIDFAANDVVLLKPNSYPIVGFNALKESYIGKPDTTYKLTWKPIFGKVAKSGDLGYTYGIWQLELLYGESKGKIIEGTYASTWEKNENGQWRFVLDTGNDGLKPENKE